MTPATDLDNLEQAVLHDSSNAELRYLFGAELAQSGNYTRAALEMSAAVHLKPDLHMARFQLGLLHLTMAQPQESITIWGPLERCDIESLREFKRGLEALIRDDFPECRARLEAGIARNSAYPPLNRDMQLILDKVRNLPAQASTTVPTAEPNAIRTDFSLYEQNGK